MPSRDARKGAGSPNPRVSNKQLTTKTQVRLPFQTSHPRCHQSDSCRESSFPFVSSPEFLTARWGSLRRPLTPATLGAACCGDVPSCQASARVGVGPASAAARWRLGRARLLRFGANYKVAVATASKAGAQSPAAQRRCPAPRRAPRRGCLTLAFFLSLAEWHLVHGLPVTCAIWNKGSVSDFAPKSPVPWRP